MSEKPPCSRCAKPTVSGLIINGRPDHQRDAESTHVPRVLEANMTDESAEAVELVMAAATHMAWTFGEACHYPRCESPDPIRLGAHRAEIRRAVEQAITAEITAAYEQGRVAALEEVRARTHRADAKEIPA